MLSLSSVSISKPGTYTALAEYPGSFVCGIHSSDGAVACTGSASFEPYTPTTVPASQPSLPSLDLAADFGTVCRIRQDGELQCWGSPFTNHPLPAGPFRQIVATASGMVAVRTDGTLAGFDTTAQQPLTGLARVEYPAS